MTTAGLNGQLVVGRPGLVGNERLQAQQRHDHQRRPHLPPPDLGREHQHQAAAGDEAPGGGRLVEERQEREHRDTRDAARDVQPVGVQRPEPGEDPGDTLAEAGHDGRDQHEDDGEADWLRQRGRAPQALVGMRPGQGREDDREAEDETHKHQQGHRRPAQVVTAGPRVQEADPDAEEAGQQDEVGGLGHIDVVRGDPPDQGQFDEQHQETGEREPSLLRARFDGRIPPLICGVLLACGPGGPGGHAHVGGAWSRMHDVKLPKTHSHARAIAHLRPARAHLAAQRASACRCSCMRAMASVAAAMASSSSSTVCGSRTPS